MPARVEDGRYRFLVPTELVNHVLNGSAPIPEGAIIDPVDLTERVLRLAAASNGNVTPELREVVSLLRAQWSTYRGLDMQRGTPERYEQFLGELQKTFG